MRATLQLAGGEAGCSQANGPEARRWLDWPPPMPTINTAAAAATARRPVGARLRIVVSDVAVAIARPAVVVGVAITAAVLRNAVAAGWRRRLRSGRRRLRRRSRRRGRRGRRRRRRRGGRGSAAGAARRRSLAGNGLRGDLLPRRGNREPAAAERRL